MHSVPVSSERAKPFSPKSRSAAGAVPPQPPQEERLGTQGKRVSPPPTPATVAGGLEPDELARQMRDDRVQERRSGRFANRRLRWRISNEKSVQCCGRGAVDSGAGVTIRSEGDRAYVSGVTRCSKIWLDPVCSAKIRANRSEEISAALVRHIRAGGTAYMVTLTLQHHKRHALADLTDSLRDAWKALLRGAPWARNTEREREG